MKPQLIALLMKKAGVINMNFKVVEKFVSINGEGKRSGQLAVFIRFAGCNLDCSYCDTAWANAENVSHELISIEDLNEYIKSTGVKNVTLTGGEPLLQEGMLRLLQSLSKSNELNIEIETNGSVLLDKFIGLENPPSFTMDYKLPSSNMENKMTFENFKYLNKKDTTKFVVGSLVDLEKAKQLIVDYDLVNKTNVYISSVFGEISLEEIVEYMKSNHMNGVTLQVQLHKIIWHPDKRSV